MMEYGTLTTTSATPNKTVSDIVKHRRGEVAVTLRHYRIRVRVVTPQEEMTEFIRFTDELAKLRQQRKLTVDKDDPTTHPAFIIQYPRDSIDGAYFIVKSYTIIV